MGSSKTLFWSSKFPWVCVRIYSTFIKIWACALEKVCHPWSKRLVDFGTAEREKLWANRLRVAVVTIQSIRSSEPYH